MNVQATHVKITAPAWSDPIKLFMPYQINTLKLRCRGYFMRNSLMKMLAVMNVVSFILEINDSVSISACECTKCTFHFIVCIPGIKGNNCEINIDECASDPCIHGVCNDEVIFEFILFF